MGILDFGSADGRRRHYIHQEPFNVLRRRREALVSVYVVFWRPFCLFRMFIVAGRSVLL